jgi:Tol biopolymer transport system component
MKNVPVLFFFFLFMLSTKSFANHNFAGEIVVEQTGPLTIKATIITYYRSTTTLADRPELFMNWGDGIVTTVTRSNGTGELLDDNTTKKNVYTSTHTFTSGGKYTVWMTDPNRTGGILNLNFPQSELIPFVLQTTVSLVSITSNQKYNSTPVLRISASILLTWANPLSWITEPKMLMVTLSAIV